MKVLKYFLKPKFSWFDFIWISTMLTLQSFKVLPFTIIIILCVVFGIISDLLEGHFGR